jgi:sugar phosphate permease
MQLAGRIPLLAAINRYTAPKLIVIARVLLGFSALFLLGSGNIALALIYIVLAGVTIGALSALDGVVARDIVQPEVFGTVMGGIGLVATLGGSLGPFFAGWLRDLFDSPVAPMLIVLFAACSAAIIFAMQQSVSRTSQATQ